ARVDGEHGRPLPDHRGPRRGVGLRRHARGHAPGDGLLRLQPGPHHRRAGRGPVPRRHPARFPGVVLLDVPRPAPALGGVDVGARGRDPRAHQQGADRARPRGPGDPAQQLLQAARADRQRRPRRVLALRALVDDRADRRLQPPRARLLPRRVGAMAPRSRRKPAAAPKITDRDPQLLRRIYEVMVLTRAVEDRMVAMYRGGDLLGSFYSGHWHEAISVGSASTLRPDDYLAPIHRDLGAHLWRGMEPWQVMASFMGKATSPTGGRDGTLHYGRLDLNIYNLPSHIPANFPVATGMAFAAKYRGEDRVCLAFCGDGSTSRADFHEALTIASVQSLPNVFIIENNQYAYSTPLRLTSHSTTFSAKAAAYGIPGVTVDGTDVLAVRDAVEEAVTRARAGDGPSIVEGVTMRMHGHAEHDPADYVVKELFEEYGKKDPVELFENVLLKGGVLDDDAVTKIREDARQVAIA